jgi:hypothetical protein
MRILPSLRLVKWVFHGPTISNQRLLLFVSKVLRHHCDGIWVCLMVLERQLDEFAMSMTSPTLSRLHGKMHETSASYEHYSLDSKKRDPVG